MNDVILTKRQIIIGFLFVLVLLLPQLLALKYDNYILKLITDDKYFYIYMAFVAVVAFVLEKVLPKTFGEIKREQRIERSTFILYFFIASFGLLFVGLMILTISL